jgi:hypothetical protein
MTAVARGVESRVGPEIDVSRIVVVATDGRELRFLRKHGWVPQDERSA